ncbi:copper chaperone PCu(A)C [Pseudoxanthomonas suwonensis]|uniref:Copper chaperone PCu(A)C n=1 Tax=Pseudoxanthomonas suwonensis TaxID=314722 RepID=A0A0E3Z252_9GAMM|nr:copper chaperone PCu(A)C [Pseudoxanthomonas suwonensis]AKC87539.1 hypothetical protein WQ53_13030 [Pseudoxanthomonas suwonensis]
MHMRPILLALPLLLAADIAPAAGPAIDSLGCLAMQDGWIRQPPAPRPMLAGFGRIANGCAGEQVVVGARSPRFGEVSLHETRMVDGVSRMREVERLPVAAGGEALLRPSGLHLMLMRPDRAPAEGERVPLVLVLADGTEVPVELVVAKEPPGHGR